MIDEFKNYIKSFIKQNDTLLIHSDIKQIAWLFRKEFNSIDEILNFIIDTIYDEVGKGGTILFPTFNWDFCSGKPFSYKDSPSQTGILSQIALNRKDFMRTTHPIYSFAVKGKYAKELVSMSNITSFGKDSPFGFLYKHNAKIVLFDVGFQQSFTYAHFIEQQLNVSYRFEKSFSAFYIDKYGSKKKKIYSMNVRDIDKGVVTHLDPIGKIVINSDIAKEYNFHTLKTTLLKAKESFHAIENILKKAPNIMIKLNKYLDFPLGQEMHDLIRELFPINRSLSGDGARETLKILQRENPELKIHSIKSGTEVFDWIVPDEWNCKEAYIITPDGEKICDYSVNNLHIVQYSTPQELELDLEELQGHLYSLPELPTAIPYVTSYYKPRWGFCISHKERQNLKSGKYKVVIKSELKKGVLNYADLIIPGESEDEIFFSTYICHPSMANNELSGPVLATFLAKYIKSLKNRRYTYRFVFAPETIGSLMYLSQHLEHLKKRVKAGFILTCVGDERNYSYLSSRYADTLADKVALYVLKNRVKEFKRYSFLDRGSDERQYCAPGVDLPVCSVMRTKYGSYPEYHTSLDDLDLITPKGLEESFKLYKEIINLLENNFKYQVTTIGEPQLGKRGLYPNSCTPETDYKQAFLYRNFLAYADGKNDLIDIAEIIGVYGGELIEIAKLFQKHKLIKS